MAVAPSGRQTVLVSGAQRAVVVEVGGGLRTYSVAGFDVLDGYGEDERCSSGRGQPLLPWPNRLDGGRYTYRGAEQQAPLTEPSKGNAIHGLTRWLPWSLLAAGTDHATLGFTLRPQPGWAWTVDLTVTYRLGPAGLRVTAGARNLSTGPCPFGAGFHPYLSAPSGRVDDLVLKVPASFYDVADSRGIPVDRAEVTGTSWDFRTSRPIDDLSMDVALTHLERNAEGLAVVEVADPRSGRRVEMRLERGWDYVMVFTGDTVGARARQGLAVEPMTGPANLLRSGESLIELPPDEPWEASWSLVPSWL